MKINQARLKKFELQLFAGEREEKIKTLTEELRSLIGEGKVEEATAKKDELKREKELLAIEKELEEEEKRSLENQRNTPLGLHAGNNNIDEMRCIVKKLMNEQLTDEERAIIKTTDSSAVIPKQFVNELQEIKKGFGSIKEYADVIPVNKNEGTVPIVDLDQNQMFEIGEGDVIVDGTFVTTDTPFKCKKYGLLQTLTSETVDDAEVEIENLIKKNFSEIATVIENKRILKILIDNSEEILDVLDYKGIQLAIDEFAPSIKAGLKVVTNTKGFSYLNNLKDKQDRPLNLVTKVNGKYYFHEVELVVVDDVLLPPSEAGKKLFHLANIKEAVKFADRKGVTVARSTEAGFENDTIKLRILERFDAFKGIIRSLKKIEF